MAARTTAARAEVVAARAGLAEEAVRLEAAGLAAVDIPARIRREPAKMAGVASGAAFLLLGGPGRVVRGLRHAVFGPDADLPKSMLPKEVEATLKKLGPDGEKVRGTLEREFADYLAERAPQRKDRELGAVATGLAASLLRPVAIRAGKQIAERLANADSATFNDALARARARQGAANRTTTAADAAETPGKAAAPGKAEAPGKAAPLSPGGGEGGRGA